MRDLDTKSAIQKFFGDLVFTRARLRGHTETRPLAPAHAAVLVRGKKLRDAHENAEEASADALAERVGAEFALTRLLEAIGRAAADAT